MQASLISQRLVQGKNEERRGWRRSYLSPTRYFFFFISVSLSYSSGWNFSLYSMSHHALALPNSIYFLEMKISTIAAPLNNTSNNYSLLPRLIFSYGSARESLPPPSSLVNNDTSITSNTTTTNSSNHDSDLSDFFYKNDSGLRFRMNGILKMDYVGGDGGAEHDQGIEDTYMASGSFAVDLMWNTTYTLRWELLTNSLGIKNPSRGAHIDVKKKKKKEMGLRERY